MKPGAVALGDYVWIEKRLETIRLHKTVRNLSHCNIYKKLQPARMLALPAEMLQFPVQMLRRARSDAQPAQLWKSLQTPLKCSL